MNKPTETAEWQLPKDALEAYRDGLRHAADMLEMSSQTIRLHAGEMTSQEMRTVKAVLAWRARVIRSKAHD